MKRSIRSAITLFTLLAALPVCAKFFDEQDVKSSPWYTGVPGSAQVSPTLAADWIRLQAGTPTPATIGYHGFIIEYPQLNALVHEVTNRLLKNWPGSAPPMALFVKGEAAPTQYGAETTGAREILLYYGVLINAKSEDELAAVIAHELGHVLLDHVKTLDYKKSMQSAVKGLGQARDLYATAEAVHLGTSGKALQIDPEISTALKQSANQEMLAQQLYNSAHATLFSRDNEYEADLFAIDLLLASGYSAMGLKTSLERLSHSYDLSTAISNQLTTSSKQLMEKSTTQLGQEVAQSGTGGLNFSDTFSTLKREFGDSALEIGKNTALDFSSRSHPVTDERIEHFSNYLQSNYPRRERKQRENTESATRFRSGPIGKLLANYSAANEAMIATNLGDDTEANRLVDVATGEPTNKDPYPHYVAFALKSNTGADTAADTKAIEQYGLVPINASLFMADRLAAAGELEQALAITNNAEARFGNVAGFYPVKIQAAVAAGDQAQVEQLARACLDAEDASATLAGTCANLAGIENANTTEKSIEAVTNIGKSLLGGATGLLNKDN